MCKKVCHIYPGHITVTVIQPNRLSTASLKWPRLYQTSLKWRVWRLAIITSAVKRRNLAKCPTWFDIMCISETWLLEAYPSHKLYIPGYQFFGRDRLVDKTGGGLSFYICDKMAPYCSILTPLSRSDPDIEAMVISFTQPKHCLTSFIHVYRPPPPMVVMSNV